MRKLRILFLIALAAMLVGCENPSSTAEDDKKTDPPAGDTSVTVTVLAVPGVTAPVRDAAPSTAAIDTA